MVINTDPSSQQHTIVVVCFVSPILSSISVAIRVWTKGFITPSISWDDCKLILICRLVASLTRIVDAALITLASTSSWLS